MNKETLPLKLISLLIAVLLFISVNDKFTEYFVPKNSTNYTTSWIRSVPVEVNYNKDNFYILGVPDTVDVKLTGPVAKVQKEVQNRSFKVRINFDKIDIGDDQKIKVEIVDLDSSIEAVSDPEFITASVRKRVQKDFTVIPVVKTERLLLGYELLKKELANDTVKISGAEETINRIYEVRAESDVKTKISSNISEEAKIIAYDINFNKIEDIDIEKNTTIMNIEVKVIEKNMPITINQIGKLPDNYILESIEIEPVSAILRTDKADNLDRIDDIFVDIELSNINQELTEISNLKVYTNSSIPYTIEPSTIKVKIKVKGKNS